MTVLDRRFGETDRTRHLRHQPGQRMGQLDRQPARLDQRISRGGRRPPGSCRAGTDASRPAYGQP